MKKLMLLCLGCFLVGLAELGAEVPKKEDVPKFIETLEKGKNTGARVAAAKDLGHLGQVMAPAARPALPTLLKIVNNDKQDSAVREACAEALGKIGGDPEQIVSSLTKIISNEKENKGVRLGAIRGLSYLGSEAKSAVSELRKIARDKDKDKQLARAAGDAAKNIEGGKKK